MKIFLKDMAYCMLCFGILLMFAFVGEISIIMGIMLMIMYGGFILLEILMEYKIAKKAKKSKV